MKKLTAALAWLDSLDLRGDTQRNVHSQFLQNWVNEDAPAASRYALGIPDEKARQQAITSNRCQYQHRGQEQHPQGT